MNLTKTFVASIVSIMVKSMIYDLQIEKSKIGKRAHVSQVRDNNVVVNAASRTSESLRRIRGTHGSFTHSSEWIGGRLPYNSLAIPPNFNGND